MPHISKKALTQEKLNDLDQRLFAAFANTSTFTRKHLYNELLTRTEHVMIAKRLEMILLLHKGVSAYEITKILRVSPSTIARFSHLRSIGKFQKTEAWLRHQKFSSQILQLLYDLAAIPFEVDRRRRKIRARR